MIRILNNSLILVTKFYTNQRRFNVSLTAVPHSGDGIWIQFLFNAVSVSVFDD
jgi:hypothetical protein